MTLPLLSSIGIFSIGSIRNRDRLGAEHGEEVAGALLGPGFVDPHTHLVFAGERATEFDRRAQGKSYLQPKIEDVVFLTMEFESGVMAHVQMSWLDPHKERRLTVVGPDGKAVKSVASNNAMPSPRTCSIREVSKQPRDFTTTT